MKKKILSILVAASMIISMLVPALAGNGDNTGGDIFGMNLYINVDSLEGSYTLGDTFSFKVTAYVGSTIHETVTTKDMSITGPAEVTNFKFKNDSGEWTDIAEFNIEEITYNEKNREFQVEFNEAGTYEISFKYTEGGETVYGSVKKYVTITDNSYLVSETKPEETTTPESSSDTNTETTTPEPSSDTNTETTTPEPSSDADTETTTSEPLGETTVAPTEETTVDPALMNKPGKVKIKKAYKKVSAKKAKIRINKVEGATGYVVAIYKNKKNAKKNEKEILEVESTKIKMVINSKILKNKKKLFVRVSAFVDVKGTKVYGKWSKVKRIKIRK